MKPNFKPIATAFAATLQLAALAAVPVAWTNSPGMPPYPIKPVPHGVPVDFRVTLKGYTEPLIAPGADLHLWYQTNGMGKLWWPAPAALEGDTIVASFGPAQDTGADRVSLFFGAPSNVFASAVLRLTHSPGFAPASLPLPVPVLDFSAVELRGLAALTNGWSFGSTIDLTDSTNYTDSALGAFAATGAVARALSYGTPTRWTDATGCVWEAVSEHFTDWAFSGVPDGYVFWLSDYNGSLPGYSWWLEKEGGGEYYQDDFFAEEPDSTELSINIPTGIIITCTREWVESGTNLVGRVALTNDIPPATDLTPLEQDIADLRTESALVYRLYSGSNVVAEVTNYNSQVHAPSLRLMQLNESNEYVTVWTETKGLARTLRDASNYTDRAIADYAAPRAWSRTTSGLGAEAPSNTTWISTPTTVIAGGFEYAKFVDTYGEVWVLTSNGMAAEFNPDTNAYFRITADDGTPIFSVEKSDAQLVGANAAGITVGESSITIPVPVVSSTAPTMYWSLDITTGVWADESYPPTGATVTWSGTAGSWVCTVSFSGTRPSSMFFKFNFLQEGSVVIRNNATTDLSSGIYVNGTKFVPTVSGNNLIWTRQQ